MSIFLIYLLKSTFCLLLFYLAYKVLLSNETFFRFNRKVLLISITLCMLLPLVKIETGSPGLIQQPFIELERRIIWEENRNEETGFLFPEKEETDDTHYTFPASLVFKAIYWTGSILTWILLFRSLIGLCLLIRRGKRIQKKDYTLVLLPGTLSPFNWGKYIVLSETDYKNHAEEILTHELAHYHKRHSWDILLMEAVILLHWFNPAAWLLKRELQEIHEYQADTAVLQAGIDATKYQLLLVKKAVGSSSYTFANSFNQSKLKKRITMMCKNQSNQSARWKSILFLPLAALALYAYASPDIDRQLQQLLPGEDTTISPDKGKYTSAFFQAEMEKLLLEKGIDPSLPQKEINEKLEDQMQLSTLLVNAVGTIMFNGQLIEEKELSAAVKKVLTDTKSLKPVLITLQFDIEAPEKTIASIYNTLGQAFTELKPELKKKHQPIAVRTVDPKNFGLKNHTQAFLSIVFMAGEERLGRIDIEETDTEEDIRKKVREVNIYKKSPLSIRLWAKKETPMGWVTDIKQIIREEAVELQKTDYEISPEN